MKKFTLVEILVVIAVIGILASLILPAVTGANQQTMRLKAKGGCQQHHVCDSEIRIDLRQVADSHGRN